MADCYYHGQSFSGPCYQCDENRQAGLTDSGDARPQGPKEYASVADRIKNDPDYRAAVHRAADEQFRLPDKPAAQVRPAAQEAGQ